jgi:putative two-component system response regulator
MRALIIDDNTTSLMLLKQLVSRVDGCEVTAFSDPAEAVRQLGHLEFDIALVDFTMPEFNGVEVIRQIRSMEKHRGVPVVMVTAENERATRLEAFDAGTTDFLTKPIDPVEFKARVRNLLALRKAEVKASDLAKRLTEQIAANRAA